MASRPGCTVCLTLAFDAVSTWIASGQTGVRDLSRGEFGVEAVPRLLDLFKEYDLKTSWFVPGVTALQYPDSVLAVATGGHEIGNHGLRHDDIGRLSTDEARSSILRTNDILERLTGQRPKGTRFAGANLGDGSVLKTLEEERLLYDSSLLGGNQAYWAPSPHSINDHGLIIRGKPLDLVELPFAWILTDFSQFESHYGPPEYRAFLPNPRQVEEVWKDEIDELSRRDPSGFVMIVLHPQVIGRGSRLAMLERVIKHAMDGGCRFATAEQLAEEFRASEVLSQQTATPER